MAIMEPVQGGPMLYPFEGLDGKMGLINQDGRLVAEPQFDPFHLYGTQYVYSDAEESRVIGLVAGRMVGMPKTGDGPLCSFTYYSLDGKSKELKCGEAVMMQVSPGGRFAVVSTKQYDWYPQEQGLFDIEANAWVVEPKDGYFFNAEEKVYSDGAIARKGTYDNITEQWYYDYAMGERRDLPADLGTFAGYLPGVQWFCFREGDPYYGACRWYDKSFNHMPQLDDRFIHQFRGKYAQHSPTAMPYGGNPAWVDRDGSIVPNEEDFFFDYDTGGHCHNVFKYENDDYNNDREHTLLDSELKPVFTGELGDVICQFRGPIRGYALLDSKREKVKASCDAYGKPLPVSEAPVVLRGINSAYIYDDMWFLLRDGELRTVDMKPYGLYRDMGDYFHLDAKVVAACEDFIWVNGWHGLASEMQSIFDDFTPATFFALDWDGNPFPDCPLEPFSESVIIRDSDWMREVYFITAGEQGPNYYWVEHEDKRGYINTRGEWLFIDKN